MQQGDAGEYAAPFFQNTFLYSSEPAAGAVSRLLRALGVPLFPERGNAPPSDKTGTGENMTYQDGQFLLDVIKRLVDPTAADILARFPTLKYSALAYKLEVLRRGGWIIKRCKARTVRYTATDKSPEEMKYSMCDETLMRYKHYVRLEPLYREAQDSQFAAPETTRALPQTATR